MCVAVEAKRLESTCPCKQLCKYEHYSPSLSYAQLSKFNIDRIVLNDPTRRQIVQNKFLHARELSQRRVEELALKDEAKLSDIKQKGNTLWQDIRIIQPAFQTDAAFAEYQNMVPFLSDGVDILRNDAFDIRHRVLELAEYWPVTDTELKYTPKFIETFLENFFEIDLAPSTSSGLTTKMQSCVPTTFPFTLFPLPDDYVDIHQYFQQHSQRKKRSVSHYADNFYANDAPAYQKLHTLDDCGYYLALKQELAKDLVEQYAALEEDQDKMKTLRKNIRDFYHESFHNTSKSPTVFPKYQPCMDLLDKLADTQYQDTSAIREGLLSFSTAVSMETLFGALDELSLAAQSADFDFLDFRDTCLWPIDDYFSYGAADFALLENFQRDFENSYSYFPTLLVSFENLREYLNEMHQKMNDEILPAMDAIDQYRNGTMTKMEMANVFGSLGLQKALRVLDARGADFNSIAREFDQGLKGLVFHVEEGFKHLYNTSFPIIDNAMFWNMGFVRHIQNSGIPSPNAILNKFYEGAEIAEITLELVEHIQNDYADAIAELKLRLPVEIEEMIKSITIMQTELNTYLEENRMNQAFFM